MEVSVVVNHYRSPKALKLALEYIQQWQREYEIRNGENTTEIIVTDSATISETKEIMQAHFPNIIFLEEKKNIGFGRSMNRALRKAKGEVIFMMNADLIIPQPQELDNLIRYIQANQQVGIVAPQLRNFDNTLQYSAFQFYTPRVVFLRRTALGKTESGKQRIQEFLLVDKVKDLRVPLSVDWVMGSALLTKKEHLAKIGLFDERFFMYMEDVDLCRRFWNNGLQVVYYPFSTMYHFHGKASGNKNALSVLWNKYTYIHFISAVKYFAKYRKQAAHQSTQEQSVAHITQAPTHNPQPHTSSEPTPKQPLPQPTKEPKPSPRESVIFF